MLPSLNYLLGRPTIAKVLVAAIWIELAGISTLAIIDAPYESGRVDQQKLELIEVHVQFSGSRKVESVDAAPFEASPEPVNHEVQEDDKPLPVFEPVTIVFERQHAGDQSDLLAELELLKQSPRTDPPQPDMDLASATWSHSAPRQQMNRSTNRTNPADAQPDRKDRPEPIERQRPKTVAEFQPLTVVDPLTIVVQTQNAEGNRSNLSAELEPLKQSPQAEPPQPDMDLASATANDSAPPQRMNRASTGTNLAYAQPDRRIRPAPIERQRPKTVAEFQPSVSAIAIPQSVGTDELKPPSFRNNDPIEYPLEAYRAGIEGEVMLKVHVSSTGSVEQVQVSRSSGHRVLDGAARDAVRNWRGLPATKNGRAVATVEYLPIRFRLRRN